MNKKTKVDPKYLRPEQAAQYISATRAFIYSLLKEKKLKSHTVGRARLIKVADLESLVEANAA